MAEGAPFDLRVKRYFPTVVDFERTGEDGTGDIKWDSLRGPAKIEARQQLSRERLVAGAEMKILQERLKWCYIKEGTNHLTNCKELAEALVAKLKAPYHGMPKAPTREW